jgi:hypothetical protein
MTAISAERDTARKGKGNEPLSYPVAASTKIWKGTQVALNASGYLVPVTAAAGLVVIGRSNQTADNSTGANGAINCEVEEGTFLWENSASTEAITIAEIGDLCFGVDNQTVAKTSGSNARSVSGIVQDVDSSGVWVRQGLSAEPKDTRVAHLPVALPYVAFANGTANGFDATVAGWRLNNAVDDQPAIMTVALPADIDEGKDIAVRARAYIIDDAVDDDVVLTLVAKINGGSDVAPVSATILGETEAEITFTIPAASVPAGASSLYLELDCAGTLDTSDAVIRSVWVTYSQLS